MKKINIKIDRVNIGLNGISQEDARASIEGLDMELLDALVKQKNNLVEKNMIKISKVDSYMVETSEIGSADLRKLIVNSVVKSLMHKTKGDRVI
jgi:hypothetical protein